MASFIDLHKMKHLKREKEFIVGWFGICVGLLLFFAGLLGRHINRYRAYEGISMEGQTFEFTWNIFGAPSSDITSFVMAIGRIVFFVSSVAALFTYQGKQMLKWFVLGSGGLLLLGSGLSGMLQSHTVHFSLAVTGGGSLLVIGAMYSLNVENNARVLKAAVSVAVLIGDLAFPLGILAAMNGYSFGVCLIVESFACLCGLAGLMAYVHYRLTTPSVHIE